MDDSEKNSHLTGKAQDDQPPWDLACLRGNPVYAALQPALAVNLWPAQWPSLAQYQVLLDAAVQPIQTRSGQHLRVVEQPSQKADAWQQGYEPRIYLQGELQTRLGNWHDCFNLLSWLTFPQAKAALNARQYMQQMARASAAQSSQPRNAAQDALTQFDESGVIILCAQADLLALLRDFQWKTLFWERRAEVEQSMRCWLFGHGLMERALRPYRGLTGKALLLPVTEEFLQQDLQQQLRQADARLAQLLSDPQQLQSPQDLAPLPLLGIPGFTPDNARQAYYDDTGYFRPGRQLRG